MADEREQRLKELEAMMASPGFWVDKDKAQELVREYQSLKESGSGDPHDAGNATLAILAGAGGDDAEDFARMLRRMYEGYAAKKEWRVRELHANENDHGGDRNLILGNSGSGGYGGLGDGGCPSPRAPVAFQREREATDQLRARGSSAYLGRKR